MVPLLLLLPTCGAVAEDRSRVDPGQIVQTAFDRMFNYPSVRSIELDVRRNGKRVSFRAFDVAYQRFEARGHTILRFLEPDYLRGNGFLIVEDEDGKSDAWLYQLSEKRLRRVGTHQKGDAFFGSDLAYEDLEHHRWDRFEVRSIGEATIASRRCHAFEADAPDDSHYERLKLFVEADRTALLMVEFFGLDPDVPLKRMRIDPDQIEEIDGKLVPRSIEIEQEGRDASTKVRITRIEVDPGLTEKSFSVLRLQSQGRDLFSMIPDAPPDSGRP